MTTVFWGIYRREAITLKIMEGITDHRIVIKPASLDPGEMLSENS